MSEFHYILDKIKHAEMYSEPFNHLLIENVLSDEHFKLLTTHPKIALPPQPSTPVLIDYCIKQGYSPIFFPGALADYQQYLKCLDDNNWPVDQHRVDRAGLVLKLDVDQDPEVLALVNFFKSADFVNAVRERFPSIPDEYDALCRIQKYLDGYEISPHPDRRIKALTWLLNINTDDRVTESDGNTQLLKFRKEKRFIQQFWEDNPDVERDWMPWHWCETVKTFNQNNSILLFAPGNNTLHGVKLHYDHLDYQRTQIFGTVTGVGAGDIPIAKYTEFDIKTDSEDQKFVSNLIAGAGYKN